VNVQSAPLKNRVGGLVRVTFDGLRDGGRQVDVRLAPLAIKLARRRNMSRRADSCLDETFVVLRYFVVYRIGN
jgi:hypothetical protein